MNKELLTFLDESPNAFYATKSIVKILKQNGYEELNEAKKYKILKNHKYYVTRNDSSVIAFNVGKTLNKPSLQITASHTDCPSFKIKQNSIISDGKTVKLNTEVYGGPLLYPWFDRTLGIAGRVMIQKGKKIVSSLFDSKEPFCLIPSVPPHLGNEISKGQINPQIDLLPLVSDNTKFTLESYISKKLKVEVKDILSFDLYLYPFEKAYIWGSDNEYFSSFHIDNLECAYTTLVPFINTFNDENINVYACFDNEEVGSLTRQGADSDFLEKTIRRVCESLKISCEAITANGILLSCDNAQGVNPNHLEKYDINNRCYMNKGIVVKTNANQSYTSDSVGIALFKSLCNDVKVPIQLYANRSDQRGGSTLGNLSNRHLSIISLDIGLAQLSMHSPLETAGTKDTDYMIKAIKSFYKKHLTIDTNTYSLK